MKRLRELYEVGSIKTVRPGDRIHFEGSISGDNIHFEGRSFHPILFEFQDECPLWQWICEEYGLGDVQDIKFTPYLFRNSGVRDAVIAYVIKNGRVVV